jgi:2-C-methyl-D-erythritol 4-phosphate cytidylyltransferase/2-C-methyl-D-erythritol 2,4-cyclodiphosphate synthase
MSSKSAAIIAGAGMGHRLGANLPKALLSIEGITLVERAFAALSRVVDEIVITAPAGYEESFRAFVGESAIVVTGGLARSDSVRIALNAISPSVTHILVHDAARALASSQLAQRVLDQLRAGESAVIPALPLVDTVKEVDSQGYVSQTPERSRLRAIQTPQGFERSVLLRAHEAGEDATDDAALVEALGVRVKVIEGEERALKITHPEDIGRALSLLHPTQRELRVGIGTDAHAFSSDPHRPLWLAGLLWQGEVGLDGHSDGDVGAHAICDALFAAASLGDLGSNFGISDPKYSGASGEVLLRQTHARVRSAGFSIVNVSLQIVGNRPKIATRRIEAMKFLSDALDGAAVSLSATSTDGLGFTGEGRGISAIATALVAREK